MSETNRVARAQYVQVLQNVRYVHEAKDAQKSQADPIPVQVDAGRYGEIVDNGEYVQPEPELILGSDELFVCLLLSKSQSNIY